MARVAESPREKTKLRPGDQLSVSRGVLCGLLCAEIVATTLCFGLFTAKNNEISSYYGRDVCTLFLSDVSIQNSASSVCHYVIGGSATVFALMMILLIEGLTVVFCVSPFTK